MDWTQFLIALGALAGGCVLRAMVPYVLSGFQIVGEEGSWKAWPRFEPKYVTTFGTAIVIYAVALATVPNAVEALMELPIVPAISLGYSGGALVREGVKVVVKRLR
jgi:hypothetical protein